MPVNGSYNSRFDENSGDETAPAILLPQKGDFCRCDDPQHFCYYNLALTVMSEERFETYQTDAPKTLAKRKWQGAPTINEFLSLDTSDNPVNAFWHHHIVLPIGPDKWSLYTYDEDKCEWHKAMEGTLDAVAIGFADLRVKQDADEAAEAAAAGR